MLFPNFKQTKKSILTVGLMSGLAMLLASCPHPYYQYNHNNNLPKPTPSDQAVNYQAQPTLYAQQTIPHLQGYSNRIQLLQFYNKGQDILLSQYDKVSYAAAGDKQIGYAQDLYTYDIASKTLTQLKTQSGQALLSCFQTHGNGAVMSEDGRHLYFVAPNTQVSALYPSDAGFTIAEYDMATKKITPLLTDQSQFGDQYYGNPAGTWTPIESIWNAMVHYYPTPKGISRYQQIALALSPDQKTLYFVSFTDAVRSDIRDDDVGVYALDLSQASHPIHLLGFSSPKIKNTVESGWSGVWLTVSPDGSSLALQSDNNSYSGTFLGADNGFVVVPTSVQSINQSINLNQTPYLFQGNNPSGVYYRFLGFDPKDSSKFFVNVDNGYGWSIEQGSVGSSQLKPVLSNQLRVPLTNAQWNGQGALLSNPQGSPTSFQIFDFNDEKSITIHAFPNLPADVISGNNFQMNYQLIDGRTVVFAAPYEAQSFNIYIYQYPLKKAKNS